MGFLKGKIYRGKFKQICLPGLNCYSCPGALGSCPIGAMQASASDKRFVIPFYALGFIMLFGVVLGRAVCGFLCPFGFLQDLLYKIKVKKKNLPSKLDCHLRKMKYVILLVFVMILPNVLTNQLGMGNPYFCKYICPVGALEGAIPLFAVNEILRGMAGSLFRWKLAVLVLIVLWSVFTYRPFCKYFCPLGALYSPFNKIAFFKMKVDKAKCTDCKACEKTCPMQVEVTKEINSLECIRCGACKNVCPHNAIDISFKLK